MTSTSYTFAGTYIRNIAAALLLSTSTAKDDLGVLDGASAYKDTLYSSDRYSSACARVGAGLPDGLYIPGAALKHLAKLTLSEIVLDVDMDAETISISADDEGGMATFSTANRNFPPLWKIWDDALLNGKRLHSTLDSDATKLAKIIAFAAKTTRASTYTDGARLRREVPVQLQPGVTSLGKPILIAHHHVASHMLMGH